MDSTRRKRLVVVGIVVPIALLHFVTGDAYCGPFPVFVNGYLLDILLPLAFHFLLSLPEVPLLKPWRAKSALVFGACASVEIAQYSGAPLFGRTFDPLDFGAYALGVLCAALVDVVVFPRLFRFWASAEEQLCDAS